MPLFTRRNLMALLLTAPLVACGAGEVSKAETQQFNPPLYPNETPELRASINKWADHYELPRELVHKLAIRESTHRLGGQPTLLWVVANPPGHRAIHGIHRKRQRLVGRGHQP